jgi:hypothetical protein
MVVGLLDTSILVDVLRRHPPADPWLAMQGQLGVAAVVWLEIIEGAPDRLENGVPDSQVHVVLGGFVHETASQNHLRSNSRPLSVIAKRAVASS